MLSWTNVFIYAAILVSLAYIGQTFQTTFSRLDGCTVTTAQRRIDVACTYSSLSGATGFQVIVQRQNQGDKLYVSQTDQMLASVMVEESGMYLVIVLAIEGAAGITGSTITAEYAETVNVDTQGLGKLYLHDARMCLLLVECYMYAIFTILYKDGHNFDQWPL